MAKSRTFVAVECDESVRSRAGDLIGQLQQVADNVKWVRAENLHWTLNFLGDVDDTRIPEVCQRVTAATADITTFDIEVYGAGAFPSLDRPRTLWVGAGKGREAMMFLQGAIEKSLRPLGFRGENRRYVPHLTIGRTGRGRPPTMLAEKLAALAEFDAGTMLVERVTVYASQLTRDGPIYNVLSHAELGG